MDDVTETDLAHLAGQISALKMVLAALLGRYAREFGDDAEDFIMTITTALSAETISDEGDSGSSTALLSFVDMAEQIETVALDRLGV